MFENLRLVTFVLFVTINTAVTALVVSLLALIKILLPFSFVKKALTQLANKSCLSARAVEFMEVPGDAGVLTAAFQVGR